MKLTLELLKADELRLVNDFGQINGALVYNRQLQAFLSKEDPPGDQAAPEPPPADAPAEPAAPAPDAKQGRLNQRPTRNQTHADGLPG